MQIVAIDTSVLINLAHLGRLDLLGSLPGLDFVVPEEVLDEVAEPGQRSQLEAAMQAGWVRLLPLTDPAGIAIFARLRASLGKGESACLALAVTLQCAIACDEKRVFLREANRLLGDPPILNTPGLLILCIRHKLLTIEQADNAKAVLAQHRYRMSFGSFAEFF